MIKMSHLFQSLIGLGVLSLYLAAWNPSNAQNNDNSRSSLPLLSTKCLTTGVTYKASKVDISIGREIFSSSLYMKASSSDNLITCQLSSAGNDHSFETLQMVFAIPDKKTYSYTVKVFLDGKPTASQQVRSGEMKTLLLNVKGVNNVAIELQGYRYSLYFLKLSLERTPNSSLIDSNSPNYNSYSEDDSRVILEETKKPPAQIPEPETIQEKIEEVEETIDKVNRFLDIFR